LATKGEYDLPMGVRKTIDFFEENDLWFQLSRIWRQEVVEMLLIKETVLGIPGIPYTTS